MAVPENWLMGSMVKRTSSSLEGVFHFQEYSIGLPSGSRRDFHLRTPSAGGLRPRNGTSYEYLASRLVMPSTDILKGQLTLQW